MAPTTPEPATLRLLGFPVHVKPGFILFMVLIVAVNGSSLGLWMAGGIAVFTLLHEVGHALAARATGADAEISLDFLAGYASYTPTRPLARWERAGIALAGPAAQIVVGGAVLVALGVNPFLRADVEQSAATLAVWWTGPMLGLLNLLPLVPLDGGSIAAAALDTVRPGRGERTMTVISLPVTLGLLVATAVSDRFWGFAPFLAFLLVFQLQAMSARQAEGPGPWERAEHLRLAGRHDAARSVLVRHLGTPRHTDGRTSPRDMDDDALAQLVALLPDPFPRGNPVAEAELVSVLVRLGRYDGAARYGAECFQRSPSGLVAVEVARCAAALGDADLAVRWLEAGSLSSTPGLVVHAIDAAPELATLRERQDVRGVREEAARLAGAG